MKAMFSLIAALIVVMLLFGGPNAMAGAYDTGEGHGYASGAGVTVLQSGIIFRVVQTPDPRPMLCCEIRQPQYISMFRRAFAPIAYYLEEIKT